MTLSSLALRIALYPRSSLSLFVQKNHALNDPLARQKLLQGCGFAADILAIIAEPTNERRERQKAVTANMIADRDGCQSQSLPAAASRRQKRHWVSVDATAKGFPNLPLLTSRLHWGITSVTKTPAAEGDKDGKDRNA